MNQAEILHYYSSPKVQEKILSFTKNKEVVGSFKDGRFFSRPDTLHYPKDIEERVRNGAVAFHCSVENWKNPMQLNSDLSRDQLNNLRSGFDIILDIDAKSKFEHARLTAIEVYKFLKELGITAGIKFSGSRGFHLSICGNALPQEIDFKHISEKYPEILQTIAQYIREEIKDKLLDKLIEFEGGVSSLSKTIENISELSPYQFVDIEQNWSNRHLFRAPYSLHHKTWYVSIPITFEQLKDFKMEDAIPSKVNFDIPFLVNNDNEATDLLVRALDWKSKNKKEEVIVKRKRIKSDRVVGEDEFPPCILGLLEGIVDGKKRSMFTLVTFLSHMNWDEEKIEKRIIEWNEKNAKPLSQRMLRTQIKWHLRQHRKLLPANCDSDLFYKSINVCKRNARCRKNPINYIYTKKKEPEKKTKRTRKKKN